MREEVELRLSGELFGRDTRGLLQHLGLHGRHLGDDRWSVWPNDDTSFVRCRDLADETEFTNHFDHLRDVPDPGIILNDDPAIAERLIDLEEQLAKRMTSGSDIAAPFHRIQAHVAMSTNSDELITIVRDAYEDITLVPDEPTGERLFSSASVHLISATDLLIRRARLPGILFRFDQGPDVTQTMGASNEHEEGYFATAAAWYRHVIGVTQYLGPLLGCLSPRFWCLAAGRPPFAVLFNLGTDIAGTRSSPMEPMQLLPEFGRMEPAPAVDLTPAACRHAIHWWTNRLNQMFRYLCDPTLFANAKASTMRTNINIGF